MRFSNLHHLNTVEKTHDIYRHIPILDILRNSTYAVAILLGTTYTFISEQLNKGFHKKPRWLFPKQMRENPSSKVAISCHKCKRIIYSQNKPGMKSY